MNGLIPETVDSVSYRKGPYYASSGDFSLAGSSAIQTIDRLEKSFISLEGGQYGWGRIAGGHSAELGDGVLTVIAETKVYDGPWEHAEGLHHDAIWAKYLTSTHFGEAAFTLSGYQGNWHPTEQIPERAIGTAVCGDEFCALDDSAGGETNRWMLTSQLTGEDWDLSLYGQYYDWAMESDPTYDFQINQFDRRYTLGGAGSKSLLDTDKLDIQVGADFRYDDIGPVGLDQHENGEFVAEISSNDIKETSIGVYTDLTWYATEQLRLMAGLRSDYYDFDVTANNVGASAGTESDSLVTPKFGLAYSLNDDMELYANWGKGFHSNDARGVVNKDAPVPGLSKGEGYELGARAAVAGVKLTASYWWLNQDSELIFVGDSNSVEPKGGSRRQGYELTLFWQPFDGVGIDAVYVNSLARYTNNDEGDYVENAIEESAQIGISASHDNWEFSARARYLGPYALTADNSQRSESLTTLNLRSAYHWRDITLYAEVINVLDSDGKDITYYYPAYIASLDPAGLSADDIDCASVDCTMSRSTEPRTLRVGASYRF